MKSNETIKLIDKQGKGNFKAKSINNFSFEKGLSTVRNKNSMMSTQMQLQAKFIASDTSSSSVRRLRPTSQQMIFVKPAENLNIQIIANGENKSITESVGHSTTEQAEN